jgi:hypothetical protein
MSIGGSFHCLKTAALFLNLSSGSIRKNEKKSHTSSWQVTPLECPIFEFRSMISQGRVRKKWEKNSYVFTSSITLRVGHSQNKHLGCYPLTKLDNIKHKTHTNAVTWATWANHTWGSKLGFLLFKLALHRKHITYSCLYWCR